MTPEAQRSLEKVAQCLSTARAELAINLSSEAGRNAYLAAFHAARAFIFERTGKIVKRHQGGALRVYAAGGQRVRHRRQLSGLSLAGLQPESRSRLRNRTELCRTARTRRRRS